MQGKEWQEFAFILDKGVLSAAEILSYLDTRHKEYGVVAMSDRVMVLSSREIEPSSVASGLGGTFKIGLVKSVCPWRKSQSVRSVLSCLERTDFYGDLRDKVRWGVSVYGGVHEDRMVLLTGLEKYFASRLRREGVKKAKCISPATIHAHGMTEILSEEVFRRRILEEGFEVQASIVGDNLYVASTLGVIDHRGFKQRDLQRPFLDSSITTPPRLARVMLNLACVSHGMVIVDPFCGLGTVLMEAMILGADVHGVDVDRRRVAETIGNLKWLAQKEQIRVPHLGKRVVLGDARKLNDLLAADSVDAVVSEPILLPTFKLKPDFAEARRLLSAAHKIYSEAIPAIRDVLRRNCRAVFTTPVLETKAGDSLSLSLDQVICEAGLKYVEIRFLSANNPFLIKGAEQIVHRNVHVVAKR